MGDVRRAQSSTRSPWLYWDIQFPVCRRQAVPGILSEEITPRSRCLSSQGNQPTQTTTRPFKTLLWSCPHDVFLSARHCALNVAHMVQGQQGLLFQKWCFQHSSLANSTLAWFAQKQVQKEKKKATNVRCKALMCCK